MPIKFTPKTEDDLDSFENLKPGEYPFTVMESAEVESKSAKNAGKLMVKVKLCVHGMQDRHVYDYFADWFSEWKLKHFCETVGLGKDYARGEIDPSRNAWAGREGYAKIGEEAASGNYPSKNVVLDYLPDEDQKIEAAASEPMSPDLAKEKLSKLKSDLAATEEGESDDVPF